MGPRAAIVSGVSILVALLTWIFLSALFSTSDGVGLVSTLVFVVALTLWLAGMAIAGLDIDWMAHPDTHSGRLLASLWLAVTGIFLPPLIALAFMAGAPQSVLQLLVCLLGLAAGGFTVLHNLEALRAGILSGPLPWLGIVAGLAFLVFWLGTLIQLPVLMAAGFFTGAVCYAGWSIWLGLELGRTAPAAALP